MLQLAIENWRFKYSIYNNFYKDLHPTYLSVAFMFGNLILIHRFKVNRTLLNRLLYLTGFLFFTLIILILRARIVWLCYFVTVPGLIILTYNLLSLRKLTITTGIVAMLLGSVYLFSNQKDIIHKNFMKVLLVDDKSVSRLDIYDSSIEVYKKHILLGVGIGDVKQKLIESYKKSGLTQLYRNQFFNSHNQYLHFLLTGGVILFIVFGATITYLLYFSIKSNDYLFFMFLIMILIVMLTENILNRINGVFFFSLFTSVFYYLNLIKSEHSVANEE
jgi:O-antigen ligase